MNKEELVDAITKTGRSIATAAVGDDALGPLSQLPGTWSNTPGLPGRGWNMIALPFAGGPSGYRLLLNQYNETLQFKTVDKGVPNRGIPTGTVGGSGDQFLTVLDYLQSIDQIVAEDSPESGLEGRAGLPIHKEPGLWINMLNHTTDGLDIARLATIPHGDSVLALGRHSEEIGTPSIPDISGLPIGITDTLESPYMEPYKQFNDNLFRDLFDPVHPNLLLQAANKGVNIAKTIRLDVNTTVEQAGVLNIPFVVKQANATEVQSTFWIQELVETDEKGKPKLRLQYSQTVFLEFFSRNDGVPGLIRWPHVSINTLEKVSDTCQQTDCDT
jgi:hypothetical protein